LIVRIRCFADTRQAAEAAQAAGQSDRARRLRSWLAEIPCDLNPKADAKPPGGAITPGRECGETPAGANRSPSPLVSDFLGLIDY